MGREVGGRYREIEGEIMRGGGRRWREMEGDRREEVEGHRRK